MKKIYLLLSLLVSGNCLFSQNIPPALNQIKVEDLKNDLKGLADANFKGRSAGTLDELKAAMWLGEKYRSIGLKPAGDDGTYFQYFTLWRNQISEQTKIELNDKKLSLWHDVSISQMANISLNSTITYLGNALEIDTNNLDVKGKIVAIEANPKGINLNVSLPTWRYSRYILVKYGMPLIRRGVAAIIFVADETAENAWADANEKLHSSNKCNFLVKDLNRA